MVSSDNLMSIVGQLMRQLRNAPSASTNRLSDGPAPAIEPAADSDDESPEAPVKPDKGTPEETLLPDDYKIDVISRILEMCSNKNYGNLVDFDWYIDILIQLVRSAPVPNSMVYTTRSHEFDVGSGYLSNDVSGKIGDELRNVAVKVKAVRAQAVRAAESILISTFKDSTMQLSAGSAALRPVSWIVGEYASFLDSPETTLTALLYITKTSTAADGLAVYLQALPKIFALLTGDNQTLWTSERKTMISLLMGRIIHALEPLAIHPYLEVQERAVEFLELLKLVAEASSAQETSTREMEQDVPLLLTQAIPSLFTGFELNSVALGAQKNVPVPTTLNLDHPINQNLSELLRASAYSFDRSDEDEFETYYHQPPTQVLGIAEPAVIRIGDASGEVVHSYQQGGEESYLDPDIVARRKAERFERNKDDPFYIAPNDTVSRTSTPLHNILQSNYGPDLDIDAIPVMQLDIGKPTLQVSPKRASMPKIRHHIQVAADETLATSGTSSPRNDDSENSGDGVYRLRPLKGKSLLQVDSSHIGGISLEGDDGNGIDFERQQKEEAEMLEAMKKVEKMRLEMQRANERIQAAHGVEGTVIKKKKKKSQPVRGAEEDATIVIRKKKPKKAVIIEGEGEPTTVVKDVIKPKKKKKKSRSETEIEEDRVPGV